MRVNKTKLIFASSIMSMPLVIAQFIPSIYTNKIVANLLYMLNTSMWFNKENIISTVGVIIYALLTTVFTLFYLQIQFNGVEIANNFKKQGATIPGIRPGKETADYINKSIERVALVGNMYLTLLIIIMHLVCNITNVGNLSIIGTSIIIVVNVIMEEIRLYDSSKILKKHISLF